MTTATDANRNGEDAIEVVDLRKAYPNGVVAVDGITFSVRRGEFFGFLGPNGAGKTTTIRVLATLLGQWSGKARLCGHDVDGDAEAVRSLIGYAAQAAVVDNDLTSVENLVLRGRLHGRSRREARQRAEELLEQFALGDVAQRRGGTLSGGLRRRLDLAMALVHHPQVLILDEPTTGLDPQSRLALWRDLQELNAAGVTIFLTTQQLEEADRLCHRVAIVEKGAILVDGPPATLKAQVGGEVLAIDCADRNTADQVAELVAHTCGSEPAILGLTVTVVSDEPLAQLAQLVPVLQGRGAQVLRVSVAGPSLEEVFLSYTGHGVRSEPPAAQAVSSIVAARLRRGA